MKKCLTLLYDNKNKTDSGILDLRYDSLPKFASLFVESKTFSCFYLLFNRKHGKNLLSNFKDFWEKNV